MPMDFYKKITQWTFLMTTYSVLEINFRCQLFFFSFLITRQQFICRKIICMLMYFKIVCDYYIFRTADEGNDSNDCG